MWRITALLGAGATVDIGGVTADSLTNEVIEEEQKCCDPSTSEVSKEMLLKKIYFALKECNPKVNINFEDVMNSLENLYSMYEPEQTRTPWAAITDLKNPFKNLEKLMILDAHSDLLKVVANSIHEYDKMFTSHKHFSLLKEFWVTLNQNHPVDLFTLNYDTILEQCFTGNVIDGFGDALKVMGVNGNAAKRFQPEILSRETTLPKVIHLHGCITFARAILQIPDHNKYAFQESYMDMYKYDTYREAREHWWGANVLRTQSGDIVFNDPILFGLRKPDKILSTYPYAYYFRELQDAIIKNHNLLIVGYSFGDNYINNWLTRMMEIHGENRRIVIITYFDKNKVLCSDAHRTVKESKAQIVSENEFEVYSKLMQEELADIVYQIAYGIKKLPENGKFMSKDGCVRIYFEGFHVAITKYRNEIFEFLDS